MSIFTHRQMEPHRFRAGFTLIELLIVVAIVAILAAIAYPSYTQYIVKTRRRAAEGCLSEYANYMERYYTTNLRYDTSSDTPTVPNTQPVLDCASAGQTGPYYTWSWNNVGASTYTITAAPINADPMCGTLSLDQGGNRMPATTGCW